MFQNITRLVYPYLGSKILVSSIIWLTYLELSPNLGNMWIRPDCNNKSKICISSIINLLGEPFRNIFLWKPSFWDMNYYMFTTFTVVIQSLILNYNK